MSGKFYRKGAMSQAPIDERGQFLAQLKHFELTKAKEVNKMHGVQKLVWDEATRTWSFKEPK